jgi:hypothetical protein
MRARLLAAEATGIFRIKLLSPSPDRLVGHDDASFEQHLLDKTQAQRKSEVQPNRMGNDLGWEPMALAADGAAHGVVLTPQAPDRKLP